jgi:hypothetical protein
VNQPPVPARSAFSDDWKRHAKATENLVCHLRFELVHRGRTREALALIYRILQHPRLSRVVFTNPVSGRLPFVLVQKRSGCEDDELRQAILAMYPYLAGYGQYHAEFALYQLGDTAAAERAFALMDGYRRPPVDETRT